ncbi:MAG: CPBP family intramembrane metalloprotease [Candidatus Sericytochromatia bacterium]|nr:CPBP family intramembrane metalloprotease [Candidatus Sericytochromatia bacterium]
MTSREVPPVRAVLPVVGAALAIELILGVLHPAGNSLSLQGWTGGLVIAIEVLAFGLPPVVAVRIWRADWRETLRWRLPVRRYALPVCAAAPALAVLLVYVQALWMLLVSPLAPTGGSQALSDALVADQPWQVLTLILIVGVVPAICEEVFFRGFLMQVLGRHWRPWPVILATAALFAGLHLDLIGMPTYLILGVWFGVLALVSGSLVWPILAHLLHNSLDVIGRNLLSTDVFEVYAGWLPGISLALFGWALWDVLYKQPDTH